MLSIVDQWTWVGCCCLTLFQSEDVSVLKASVRAVCKLYSHLVREHYTWLVPAGVKRQRDPPSGSEVTRQYHEWMRQNYTVCLDRLLHLIHHDNNGVKVWYGIPHPRNCTIGLPVFDANVKGEGRPWRTGRMQWCQVDHNISVSCWPIPGVMNNRQYTLQERASCLLSVYLTPPLMTSSPPLQSRTRGEKDLETRVVIIYIAHYSILHVLIDLNVQLWILTNQRTTFCLLADWMHFFSP